MATSIAVRRRTASLALRRSVVSLSVAGALAGLAAPATAGTFFWSSGNYTGLPNPILADDTVFAFGDLDKNFSGVNLVINGGLQWDTGARLGFVSSSVTNNGLIELLGNANLTYAGGGASNVFNNGTFRKSTTFGLTQIGNNISFVNSGVIDAQIGTIDFAGGSATFNAGTQFIGAGFSRVTGNAAFNGGFTSANLILTSGNFTGTGAVMNGTTTWSGGQLVGGWTIAANQTLNALSGIDKNFSGANVTNGGTINWLTAERMGFLSSTFVNNGLIDIQADANLSYAGGGASNFTNTATFRKSSGSGSTQIGSNIIFANSGVIDARTGTIDFAGGTTTFNAGTQFIGAGVNRVSGNAAFNGGFTSSNLVLASGNFTGTGAILNGIVTWSGGQFVGGWTIPSGQTLNAVAGGDKNFSGANVTNGGTINWLTAERMGFVSSTFLNNGLIDIKADANLSFAGGGASNFSNTATFRKSGGSGTTQIGGNINFTNSGVIDAQLGTIDFTGGAATFIAGTQFIGAGVNRVSSNATFNGTFTSSNLVLAGGDFTGSGPGGASLDGIATWTGGQFVGTWTLPAGRSLEVNSGGDKNFNGASFLNSGTIDWRTPNRIGFISSNVTNAGLLDIQTDANLSFAGGGASNFSNTGTFRKRASNGSTNIGGNINFQNSGLIDAQTGTIDFVGGSATFNANTQFTGAGIVRVSSAATFNGAFTSANLVLANGNFTGGNAVANGTIAWTGGQFVGAWQLADGQTLNASGLAAKNFNGTTFTNAGTINWQTLAQLGFVSSNVTNKGLIDIQADANLSYVAGGASNLFNNSGATFRKSAGAGTTVVGTNVNFINAGVVQAQSGTIDFAGGGATFNAGTQFTGAGINRVSAAATFNGAFTSANLVLAGGNFTGGAAVLQGTAEWTGGQFAGGWTVGSGHTLNAKAGTDKNLAGTSLTNDGTIRWQSANRIGFISSNLTNTGLIDIQADADLSYAGGGASNVVNNGILRKSGGSGTTTIGINVNFSNPGTIEALSGTIALPANFTNPGTIKGTATVQTNVLTNTGKIAPGASPGALTLSGSLVMTNSSILEIELASLASFDTLAVTGTALLDGVLTVRKFGDYSPHIGDTFKVMTYASRVGASTFDAINTVGFGGGVAFGIAYNPGDVTISVTAVPEPETYALMVAGLGVVAWAARRRRART